MNSRGLELQPTDIIKADIIGQLSTEKEREEYSQRWEDMEVELDRSGFNDLFSYVRMIYAKEKAKRSLLDEFRTHVLTRVREPKELISEVLEPFFRLPWPPFGILTTRRHPMRKKSILIFDG